MLPTRGGITRPRPSETEEAQQKRKRISPRRRRRRREDGDVDEEESEAEEAVGDEKGSGSGEGGGIERGAVQLTAEQVGELTETLAALDYAAGEADLVAKAADAIVSSIVNDSDQPVAIAVSETQRAAAGIGAAADASTTSASSAASADGGDTGGVIAAADAVATLPAKVAELQADLSRKFRPELHDREPGGSAAAEAQGQEEEGGAGVNLLADHDPTQRVASHEDIVPKLMSEDDDPTQRGAAHEDIVPKTLSEDDGA